MAKRGKKETNREEPHLYKVIRGEAPSIFDYPAKAIERRELTPEEDESITRREVWNVFGWRRLERLEAQVESLDWGESVELPTLHEFRYELGTLTQKLAAKYLRCTTRTIRTYIQKGRLSKTRGGKVVCSDDRWARKIREVHPQVRLK